MIYLGIIFVLVCVLIVVVDIDFRYTPSNLEFAELGIIIAILVCLIKLLITVGKFIWK